MALLLKPASPTPSNTESPRSFQRDTERVKRLYGTEKFTARRRKRVPIRPQVTPAATYGKGNAPLK